MRCRLGRGGVDGAADAEGQRARPYSTHRYQLDHDRAFRVAGETSGIGFTLIRWQCVAMIPFVSL